MKPMSATERVVQEAVEPIERPIQLPLLPAEDAAEIAGRVDLGQAVAERRRGRPPGSVNRSTADWRAFVLARYPSPLIGLAEVANRPVEVLAAELGCTKLEALDRQIKAKVELLPYLHGKMPVDVNLTTRGLVALSIEIGDGSGEAGDGAIVVGGEIVENQGDG